MGLRSRLARRRQSQRLLRVSRQQKKIEIVAYQLYKNRVQGHHSGDEASDWALAQRIVQNPLRRSLYSMNQAAKSITAPSEWFALGIAGKTSWEWMELLLIPLFLAVGAFYLENRVERRQESIAAARYEQEVLIADERAKQEALNSYFEQMKDLLLSEQLRESSAESEVRSVARAITTTTIRELGSERNALLISFLQESNLIQKAEETDSESEGKSFPLLIYLRLSGANLRGADLSNAELFGADLRGANLRGASLSSANLNASNLRGADLRGADLSEVDLSLVFLRDADLRDANLTDANLNESRLHLLVICRTTLPAGFTVDPDRDC